MNIFAVDDNPILAARSLHDAHVIKMATESAQILSTVVDPSRAAYSHAVTAATATAPATPRKRYLIASGKRIYSPTHAKHPCVLWAASRANWRWLYLHAMGLCAEYEYRFGRVHGAQEVISALASEVPPIVPVANPIAPSTARCARTPFALAMPEVYRGLDPIGEIDAIAAYRRYYIGEKLFPGGRSARWTRRSPPEWIKPHLFGPHLATGNP